MNAVGGSVPSGEIIGRRARATWRAWRAGRVRPWSRRRAGNLRCTRRRREADVLNALDRRAAGGDDVDQADAIAGDRIRRRPQNACVDLARLVRDDVDAVRWRRRRPWNGRRARGAVGWNLTFGKGNQDNHFRMISLREVRDQLLCNYILAKNGGGTPYAEVLL